MGRSARDLDAARGQSHRDQDVERHQAAPRPHLYRREVHSGEHFPMRFEKRLPGRRSLTIGSRLNPVFP